MKVALVGLGYWGKILLPIIISLEDRLGISLVWVCDHHKKNWAKFKKKYPKIIFGNYFDKMLNDIPVEAIFIATKQSSHYVLAKKSLEKGCHVFIEKPFTGKLELACKIREISVSRSLVLMVGYRLLYSPSIRLLKKSFLHQNKDTPLAIEAVWKNWGRHQKGGVHWDLGSHYIAAINYLLDSNGEVITVAPISQSDSGVVENIGIFMKHRNSLSRIDASWNSPNKEKRLTINTGSKLINIVFNSRYPFTVYNIPCESSRYHINSNKNLKKEIVKRYSISDLPEHTGIERMFSEFIKNIRSGKQEISTISIAINVIETLKRIDEII